MYTHRRRHTLARWVQYTGDNNEEVMQLLGPGASEWEEYIMYRYDGGMAHLKVGDGIRVGETGDIKVMPLEEFNEKYEVLK